MYIYECIERESPDAGRPSDRPTCARSVGSVGFSSGSGSGMKRSVFSGGGMNSTTNDTTTATGRATRACDGAVAPYERPRREI